MITNIPKHIGQFIFLVLLQGLIFNNVALFDFVTPYIYVLFILSLPFDTAPWLVLILSFVLGFFVDLFTHTLGFHISSAVFLGYVRHYVLKIISPREGYEKTSSPSIQDMGFTWFITYSGVLVFLHHLFLFTIEIFRFSEFFITLSRALACSIFTLTIILVFQLFSYKKKSRI